MFGAPSTIGNLSNFDHDTQDWKIYKSRLQQWFIANCINEESDKAGIKRKAILLSALSERSYQLASNLALPEDVTSKSYESILQILDDHFTPKHCGFVERHKFYAATQQIGETPSQWAARLRGLAGFCRFKHLEDALLDKFVIGMLPGMEKEKLFSLDIKDLTLHKAVEVAECVRCARSAAAAIPVTVGQESVFKIRQQGRKNVGFTKQGQCEVCGYNNHKTSECRYSSYKCKKCNQKGHLKKKCPNKEVKYLQEDSGDDKEDDGEHFNARSVLTRSLHYLYGTNKFKIKIP